MNPRSILLVIVSSASMTFAAGEALACRPADDRATILSFLPAAAHDEEIAARVEVIGLLPSPFPPWAGKDLTRRVKVRVVEAIKGVSIGQVFPVETSGEACDQLFSQGYLGWQGYIAGRFRISEAGETIFIGPRRLLGGKPVRPLTPAAAERPAGTR